MAVVPWRGKWQPTPVFLPGKSHGQKSLGGRHTVRGVAKSRTRLSTHTQSKIKIFFFNGCCLEQDKDGGRMTMCLQYLLPDRML